MVTSALDQVDFFLGTLYSAFGNISLRLPNAKVFCLALNLTITQLVCCNLDVRDIRLVHVVKRSTSHNLAVNVAGLLLSCTFCWEYR